MKNEEIHVFTWNLWFLHILGIFADFQQNGKFYEIRNKQLNLPSKYHDFEHLFRNHEIWAKMMKNEENHGFYDFWRNLWNLVFFFEI